MKEVHHSVILPCSVPLTPVIEEEGLPSPALPGDPSPLPCKHTCGRPACLNTHVFVCVDSRLCDSVNWCVHSHSRKMDFNSIAGSRYVLFRAVCTSLFLQEGHHMGFSARGAPCNELDRGVRYHLHALWE